MKSNLLYSVRADRITIDHSRVRVDGHECLTYLADIIDGKYDYDI